MRNVTNAKEQLKDPAFDILIIFLIEVQNCSNCLHKEWKIIVNVTEILSTR